jgi:hypothetical protein
MNSDDVTFENRARQRVFQQAVKACCTPALRLRWLKQIFVITQQTPTASDRDGGCCDLTSHTANALAAGGFHFPQAGGLAT